MSEREKIADYLEALYIEAEEIVIKNKKHPTRIKCKQVQKTMTESLRGLACTDERIELIR